MSVDQTPVVNSQGPQAVGAKKYLPTRKVGAGALAGAITVVVVWALNSFVLPADKPITPEIAASLTTILTFIVSYFISEPA